jgi:integrase
MNRTEITDFCTKRFFMGYVLDFKAYPDSETAAYFSRKRNTTLDLTGLKGTQLAHDIKDILLCCMVNQKPCSYQSGTFRRLFSLPGFMEACGYDDFSCIDDWEKADGQWVDYWKAKGLKSTGQLKNSISNSCMALCEYRDTRTGFDRNIWYREILHINKERLNSARSFCTMNFWNVTNEASRELLKVYFRYLIGRTEQAYSTIYNSFIGCCAFCEFHKDKSLLDITHADVQAYQAAKNAPANQHNRMLYNLQSLYRYLSVKNLFAGKCPVLQSDFKVPERKHKYNTVPDVVILETFRYLHLLRKDYLLIYLINMFTGIRISDICQLTTDCVYRTGNGYFLSHDVQKMQDVGGIPISKELYDMIQEQAASARKQGLKYLFVSARDREKPCNAGTYSAGMKKFFNGCSITLPNGEPYHFTTHAFRHTIATTLYKMGMPSALIQTGILHHMEINMTRSYIDIDAKSQAALMEQHGLYASAEKKMKGDDSYGTDIDQTGFHGIHNARI